MADNGIEAARLTFMYGPQVVVNGVDLGLVPGQWVCVLGPNGCGKSTLLRLIVGLLRPHRGEVRVDGIPLGNMRMAERGRLLGFLPQHGVRPEGLTVEEVVALGRLPHLGLLGRPGQQDKASVEQAMAVTEIGALARRDITTLSGGEAQRVLLARALAAEPRYLLLDEPTNHLDLHHQVSFLQLVGGLRQRGVGVLTVLHDPNQAWEADAVILLRNGAVFAHGPPDAVLTSETLGEVYGPEITVEKTTGGRSVVLPQRREAP